MITCPTCEHQYEKQPRCPNCGDPAPLFSKRGRALALIVVAGVLIGIYFFIRGMF